MTSLARSRWRSVGRYRWRVGLCRGEWWIGARHSFMEDALIVGVFGLTLVVVAHA